VDSVDPALTEQAETTLRATPGVLAVAGSGCAGRSRHPRRVRDLGGPGRSVVQAHDIAVGAEHGAVFYHAIPQAHGASVHADPLDSADPLDRADHHAVLAHHASARTQGRIPASREPIRLAGSPARLRHLAC